MAMALTLFLIVLAVAWFAMRNFFARRRAVRDARAEQLRREVAQREVRERLLRLKEKNDLTAAARAIGDDPARAARVVGRIMRKD